MNKVIPFDSAKVSIEKVQTVVGLPDGLYVEYYGLIEKTGHEFVIFRPAVDWNYNNWTCLLGKSGVFEATPIKKVTRYRDGGTTVIELEGVAGWIFTFPFKGHPYLEDANKNVCGIKLYGSNNGTKELVK